MTEKDSESEIQNLVQEATDDPDLNALLDAMLDTSRPICKILCLPRVDLLLTNQETGLPMKWLVWANETALSGDLSRIKDFRARAGHEMGTIYASFQDVLQRITPIGIPQVVFGPDGMQLLGEEKDPSPERIEEMKKQMDSLIQDGTVIKDFFEVLADYLINLVKGGVVLPQFIDAPIAHLKEFFSSTGMSFDQYSATLETLVNLDLVINQFTVFWCDECSPAPRVFATAIIERPKKLMMKCINCSREMNTISFYEVCEEVTSWLNAVDGILGVLVGHSLAVHELDWKANVMETRESDFIVEQEGIVWVLETKVHRIYQERDHKALGMSLTKDLSQLAKTCSAVANKVKKPVKGALIWNQEVPEDIAEKVRLSKAVSDRYDPSSLTVVPVGMIVEFIKQDIVG